LYELSGNPTT